MNDEKREKNIPPLEFLRLLWEIEHRLNQASKRLHARTGITGLQRLVVRFVGENPLITAGRLAQILHADASTLTDVIQRLVEKGVLSREEDAADRRRTLLRVTDQGQGIIGMKESTVEESVATGLSGFNPEAVDVAFQVLSAVARAIEESA